MTKRPMLTIDAPPATEPFAVETLTLSTRPGRLSGGWYAPEEGWFPNAEVERQPGKWVKCHVHREWDRKRLAEWGKPPGYVISRLPGALASTTEKPLRPLTKEG